MSRQVAVVYEGPSDFRIATELADRVVVEAIPWMADDDLEFQRTWLDRSNAGLRLVWAGIDELAREAGVTVSGLYDEEPGEPDAHAASRAILYLQREFPDLEAILLVRDQDDQPLRRRGLEQARKKHGTVVPVVVGLAVLMREAWVLSGFDPVDDEELTRLQADRQRLGLDPRIRSHEVRDPKLALRELTGDDRERERQCWARTPLDTLRERGADNGLTDFLADVRLRLAVLF